jgi:osmoprotectant transport system permease protein
MLERRRSSAEPVIRGVGLLQTLPSIALLAFMIPLLGIGVVPAVVALFLYSLYPILRNTYTGVRDAAPDAVGAAWALGMTPRQILRHVRLPLAAPVLRSSMLAPPPWPLSLELEAWATSSRPDWRYRILA